MVAVPQGDAAQRAPGHALPAGVAQFTGQSERRLGLDPRRDPVARLGKRLRAQHLRPRQERRPPLLLGELDAVLGRLEAGVQVPGQQQ